MKGPAIEWGLPDAGLLAVSLTTSRYEKVTLSGLDLAPVCRD
jgi:hypothetical protein